MYTNRILVFARTWWITTFLRCDFIQQSWPHLALIFLCLIRRITFQITLNPSLISTRVQLARIGPSDALARSIEQSPVASATNAYCNPDLTSSLKSSSSLIGLLWNIFFFWHLHLLKTYISVANWNLSWSLHTPLLPKEKNFCILNI